MSRIGNKSIAVSSKVEVKVNGKHIAVRGPNATLEYVLPDGIDASLEDGKLIVARQNDTRRAKSLHGLSRSLLANMVTGVEKGFTKELEIRGVGYRAQVQGKTLVMNLGHSHPIEYAIPEGITITVNNARIIVQGADKQEVGQVAATIRSYRQPEPYKGKGIRYVDEYVIQKEGKSV